MAIHDFYTIPWRNTRYRFGEVLNRDEFEDDSFISIRGDDSWQR